MLWSVVIYVIFIELNNKLELISTRKASWIYSWISLEGNSTNENLLGWQVGLERVGRDLFVLSGTFMVNIDVTDDTTVQFSTYRSSSGSNDYVRMPIEVPKMPFMKYLNTAYKETIMDSFKNCTDFPHTKEALARPLEQKTYEFNKCVVGTEQLPAYLMSGYYKLLLHIHHAEVDCFVQYELKIEQKIF